MVDLPEKTRRRLYLIDGYALIYRAFYAMISRPLTTSKGENTSAAFGLTRFLLKLLEEYRPDYLGVVMDSGTSLRTELYPEYKATREKMPDELRASLPRIRELVEAFRIPILELEDHEADDVIGTLARLASEAGVETVIVSGDKDFYQLIDEDVKLLNPGRGGSANVDEEWVSPENAAERLGVPPERVRDYLALIGDSSDNIPGARGIGPKTAVKLIETYGGVEEILEHAEEVSGKRARDRLKELFAALEFHGLVREVAAPEPDTGQLESDYRTVTSADGVRELAARVRDRGRAAIHVIASGSAPLQAGLVGLALALEQGSARYLPLGHRPAGELDLGGHEGMNLPELTSEAMAPLVEALEDHAIRLTGHDLKFALLVLRQAGLELRGLGFDVMIGSYLLEPGRREHDLDSAALQRLGHSVMTREDLCGTGRSATPVAECDLDRVRDYACEKADLVLRLQEQLEPQLEEYQLDGLYREVEGPLVPVLADMEQAGIGIDTDFFQEISERLARELRLIEEDIYKEAGEEFNINSTPQLREILFEKLDLPVIKKTKTGPSTDASVLEELAGEGHRIPTLILEYRQLDKLKGTYVDALPLLVNPATGRIHSSFNQAVAATGRLSSSDPNLQNIPIRTQVGAELRKGFIPAEGMRFISADYSQIELRVLAHLSGDETFTRAFRSDADIHRETAALVFDVDVDEVTAEMRAAAKTINFATIYGIGPYALSKQLGTSVQDAKTFIDNYFERLPDVRRYLDRQIGRAYEDGYVETLTGRRRYIPEVKSKNYNVRQFGERAATNAPVQGSAADIIKIAMIDIHAELAGRDDGTRMLLQVHDELLFEAPTDAVNEIATLVTDRMEGAFELDVPLRVEVGTGESWYECK